MSRCELRLFERGEKVRGILGFICVCVCEREKEIERERGGGTVGLFV